MIYEIDEKTAYADIRSFSLPSSGIVRLAESYQKLLGSEEPEQRKKAAFNLRFLIYMINKISLIEKEIESRAELEPYKAKIKGLLERYKQQTIAISNFKSQHV